MKLKLPILTDLKGTFSRWAAELRGVNFLTEKDLVWKSWNPTFAAAGGMTFTGVNILFAKYVQIGKIVHFKIRAVGTTGGAASAYIYASLPVVAKAPDQERFISNIVQTGGAGSFSAADITLDGSFMRFPVDAIGSFWALGPVTVIIATGTYEAA